MKTAFLLSYDIYNCERWQQNKEINKNKTSIPKMFLTEGTIVFVLLTQDINIYIFIIHIFI